MRLILLDSGPLGLLANPRGTPRAERCREWVKRLTAAGATVVVPEIADYEVRRKLLHLKATASLRRLDMLRITLAYSPLTTEVMDQAAELWASARRVGLPTAPPEALDGDCILAATALVAVEPDDSVVIATENVGHLSRYVEALPWDQIAPDD